MRLSLGDGLAFGLGVVLASAFWVAARRAGQERRAFAIGLAMAALV